MMLILGITLLYSFSAILGAEILPHYEEWKETYGKDRSFTPEGLGDGDREKLYNANLETIREHNRRFEAGEVSYTMGVNQFTDLTAEEFQMAIGHTPVNPDRRRLEEADGETLGQRLFASQYKSVSPDVRRRLGDEDGVDWRNKEGVISYVKSIGNCGAGYAAATVDAIESALSLRGLESPELSMQEIIDCADGRYGNMGCLGGRPEGALNYAFKTKSLASEDEYHYKGKDGTCDASKTNRIDIPFSGDGIKEIASYNVKALKDAVKITPVIVQVRSTESNWQFYHNGVAQGCKSGSETDHAALLVGYTSETATYYRNSWIIKNNWGPVWGEKGYIYLPIGANGSHGTCGILTEPMYPDFGQ